MARIPPELPLDGLKITLLSFDFQQVRIILLFISSIFVSWTKTKHGLCMEIIFLKELRLTRAFNPLIFHYIINIIIDIFDDNVWERLNEGLLPN